MLTPPLLLLAGAVALYVAGRAAADAGGGRDSITSVVVALAVPAAAAGATAIALGHEATALGAVHGAACSTALLAGGLALLTRPNPESHDAPDRSAAALVPIAAVVVVAGFAGTYDLTAAVVTLAVGATVLAVLHRPGDPAAGPAWGRAIQILLAFAAAGGGLLLATAGADGLSAEMGWEVSRLAGTLFVGPMLALPVIGITGRIAAEGRPARAASAAVAASAATLGIVLPLVAGSAVLVRWLRGEPVAVPVPLSLWRVDAVLLLLAGLLFLPAALGRWRPGRTEGIGLIVAYVAYLTVSVAAVR